MQFPLSPKRQFDWSIIIMLAVVPELRLLTAKLALVVFRLRSKTEAKEQNSVNLIPHFCPITFTDSPTDSGSFGGQSTDWNSNINPTDSFGCSWKGYPIKAGRGKYRWILPEISMVSPIETTLPTAVWVNFVYMGRAHKLAFLQFIWILWFCLVAYRLTIGFIYAHCLRRHKLWCWWWW